MKKALLIALLVGVSAVSAGTVGGGVAMALVRAANPVPGREAPSPEVTVASAALGEPVGLEVRLPLEYGDDPARRFPVLWVTDLREHLDHAAHTIQVLSTVGIGEPMIVVAVPRSSPGRAFDFIPAGMGDNGGGAARFLSFLVDEARPALDAEYRTTDQQLLFGHSLGGLFVTWALTQRPDAYEGWIASSPSFWVGGGAIEESLGAYLDGRPASPPFYFTSLGSQEGNEMSRYFDRVGALVDPEVGPGWRWTREITPLADHGSNPRLSLPAALRAFWAAVPPS
jgi:predicted alpha/beta superfamily hydrolase